MNEVKKSGGFTKSGFSRSFGCCSRFKSCEMGKGACFYEESDPETMEACKAWLRNNRNVEPVKDCSPIIEKENQPTVAEEPFEALDQLSLF